MTSLSIFNEISNRSDDRLVGGGTVAERVLLHVSNIKVVYGGNVIGLRGASLTVERGTIVALLGPNGAGKTTLLRAVTGLLPTHRGALSGTITIDGHSIAGLEPASIVRLGVAQVMEGRRIFGDLTVDENLRVGALTRRGASEIRKSFEHALELFPDLRPRLRSKAGYLSGGQQQMLAISRALMADPKLLILDEPSLGLAPIITAQIGEIITQINKSGTSILLVEQNAAMALRLARHVYILENGMVAKEGAASNLINDPIVRELYLGIGDRHRLSIEEGARKKQRGMRWAI